MHGIGKFECIENIIQSNNRYMNNNPRTVGSARNLSMADCDRRRSVLERVRGSGKREREREKMVCHKMPRDSC